MKRMKFAVITVCVLVLSLSVLAKNNFNANGIGWFGDSDKEIKYEQFIEFVNTNLVNEIITCYTEAYPHAFMTKCYSEIYCEVSGFQRGEITADQKIWAESTYSGEVVFDDCGTRSYICSFRANYKEKKIEVRESFFGEWQLLADYTKAFCKKTKAMNKE